LLDHNIELHSQYKLIENTTATVFPKLCNFIPENESGFLLQNKTFSFVRDMQILFWSEVCVLCKSGICWPVEGMHYTLKYVSFFLPLTFSTESLRAILSRGWEISQPVVYQGFIATGVWIVVFLITSLLVLKFRKG
jgi:hypothetical protein